MSQETPPPQEAPDSGKKASPSRSTRTVFSRVEKLDKKSSTIRKFDKRSYWLVEKDDSGGLTIQQLNKEYLPSGDKEPITLKDLLRDYKAEPDFFSRTVFPKLRMLEESIDKADAYREESDHRSAAYEYGNALDVDVENIRANFGAALSYLEQGEESKAINIFNRLIRLNGTFLPCHKHLFNEFGISMRKHKMYRQSVAYYTRALELTQEDENLHFNIARPLFEQGSLVECVQHLVQSNVLKQGNAHAIRFLAWLKEKSCVPKIYISTVDAILELYSVTDLLCLPDADPEDLPESVPEECLEVLRRIDEEACSQSELQGPDTPEKDSAEDSAQTPPRKTAEKPAGKPAGRPTERVAERIKDTYSVYQEE